jgi:hypothetical protein
MSPRCTTCTSIHFAPHLIQAILSQQAVRPYFTACCNRPLLYIFQQSNRSSSPLHTYLRRFWTVSVTLSISNLTLRKRPVICHSSAPFFCLQLSLFDTCCRCVRISSASLGGTTVSTRFTIKSHSFLDILWIFSKLCCVSACLPTSIKCQRAHRFRCRDYFEWGLNHLEVVRSFIPLGQVGSHI